MRIRYGTGFLFASTRSSSGDGHRLIPIHTPGHSADHVCFLEPDKKWLFTGDLYLATRPRLFRADEDLAAEMASLEKVLAFDFETLFRSHKGVVPDGYGRVQEKLAYFRNLVGEVRELHREGIPVPGIARRLLGKPDAVNVITLNHLCQENLIHACLQTSACES